jgi:predicted Zn finger-like uncharacterized protein
VKISCPTCAAKYSVADEKIQSRLAKIRCRKCSSTIVIDGMTTPANVYIGDAASAGNVSGPHDLGAAEPAPGSGRFGGVGFSDPASGGAEPVGPAADEYAVDIADNDQRNMTIHQIVGAYNEGLITADTYIWKEGMADWQTLSEVRAVASALHAAARPAGAVAMPAAVRRADNGGAADLFGRIESAGGEDDITTSAPEPAFSAGTGARNESSVLFSLSALTGTPDPGVAQSGAPKRRASADDSGLIDLQALTASEANAGGGAFGASAGAFGASPLISAPLGGVSGPALGSPLASGYGNRRSGGRAMIIAASVLAVGILAAAAVMVVKPGSEDTDTTSSLDKAAAGAPEKLNARPEPGGTVPAAVREEPEPGGEAPSEDKNEVTKNVVAADELPAAPEPAAAKAPVQRAPVARPRTPTRAKPQAAAPAPAPEPPADPTPAPSASGDEPKKKKKAAAARCECKPADLMCAMRCSAKK